LTGFPCDILLNKKLSLQDVWDCLLKANGTKGMAVATIDMRVVGQ
jgi:hypothetical protein